MTEELFRAKIRHQMKVKKMSYRELASRVKGQTKSGVHRKLNRKSTSLETAIKLLEATGLKIEITERYK